MQTVAAERSRLIGAAYEAALDPGLWPSFLRAMNQSVGASASCIFLHDFADASAPTDLPDSSLGVLEGFDPKAWEAYTQYFAPLNVWTRMEESLPTGTAVTSSMLYSDEHLPNTEFGADWLRPQNLFYALGGVVDRQGTVALKMSFVRPKSGGAFDRDTLALWQAMMPHVQRAADLHRRLAGAEQRSSDAEAALAVLSTGVVLLGANKRVRFVNASASALMGQQRGLSIDRNGHLVAASNESNRLLQREVFIATSPLAMSGSHATIDRTIHLRGGGGPLDVSVAPLPVRSERFATRAAAVVFLNDPTMPTIDLTAALIEEYRMTRAEARLTSALVGGSSLAQYSEHAQLSLNTVRTQLRAASSKAGAKRQADLIRIVLTGPAAARQRSGPVKR